MKKARWWVILPGLPLLALSSAVRVPEARASNLELALMVAAVTPTVIYGDDDRQDLEQVQSQRFRQLADGTVALFKAGAVVTDPDTNTAQLQTSKFGDAYNLCKDEPFRDQPTGAFCSGSLVGPDLVMTAGHCIKSEDDCKNTKFVFGFQMGADGKAVTKLPAGEVYGCGKIVSRALESAGVDYAVVKLDRAVDGHKPLKVNRSGKLAGETPLVVIGHPAGLPVKVAGGAAVREVTENGFFTSNLDTYGGNSGSAVFNARTGEIEGILVRGDTDFVYDAENQCRRSNRVPNDGGRGEDVTSVSQVLAHVPDATGPKAVFNAKSAQGGAFKELAALVAAD